jgi:hypothetical protein
VLAESELFSIAIEATGTVPETDDGAFAARQLGA